MSGDGFTSHIAGLSKSQLYEIMSQMKYLIEQNQQQARQILVDNPVLTKALFHAQIMLGMVKPSQVASSIMHAPAQTQALQVGKQSTIETVQSLPSQPVLTNTSQPLAPIRPSQPSIPVPSAAVSQMTFQAQGVPQNPPQTKAHPSSHAMSASTMQTPQIPLPPPASQVQNLPHNHMTSSQAPQAMQIPGLIHQPLQPPLPQFPRPSSSMQNFPHQVHLPMPHNIPFQQSSAQQLIPQPMFHSGSNPSSSYPLVQPPLPNHPPPQLLYQSGPSQSSTEYIGQAGGSSNMQVERGAPWMTGPPPDQRPTAGIQFPGPPPSAHGQAAPIQSGLLPPQQQHPQPPPLTPDMERALLQQVMSLTPEQINLLPPEQRNQVKQLQEMLLVRNS